MKGVARNIVSTHSVEKNLDVDPEILEVHSASCIGYIKQNGAFPSRLQLILRARRCV